MRPVSSPFLDQSVIDPHGFVVERAERKRVEQEGVVREQLEQEQLELE